MEKRHLKCLYKRVEFVRDYKCWNERCHREVASFFIGEIGVKRLCRKSVFIHSESLLYTRESVAEKAGFAGTVMVSKSAETGICV